MLWDDFIGEPDNFEKKRDYKAALVINLLMVLSGLDEETAIRRLNWTVFGHDLLKEETKAWAYPEYWAYRHVCREFEMEPQLGRDLWEYDYSVIPTLESHWRESVKEFL